MILNAPLNRLSDSYFKFAIATEENKDVTVAFINAAMRDLEVKLKRPELAAPLIEDVTFLDRETSPFFEDAKLPRFDVLARALNGWTFHIELQLLLDLFFLKRGFFYTVSDYFLQARRGKAYSDLQPVIFIAIVDFLQFGPLIHPRPWHTLHRILNVQTGEWAIQEVEFHIVELPVMRQLMAYPETDFDRFLCYFGNIGGDDLMTELAVQDPNIARLMQIEEMFRTDPILLRRYLIEERSHRDYLTNLDHISAEGEKRGMERGINLGGEEGITQGREEEKFATARRFKAMGLSHEQIAEGTGLPLATIEAL